MKKTALIMTSALCMTLACTTMSGGNDQQVEQDTHSNDIQSDEGPNPDGGRDDGGRDAGNDLTDSSTGEDNVQNEDDGSVTPDGTPTETTADEGPGDVGEDTATPRGRISVIPYVIDFAYVPLGASSSVPITVRNDGDGALRIDKFVTTGPASIKMDVGFEPQVSGAKTTYVVDPPEVLKPGQRYEGKVVFEPTEPVEAYTEIRVFSSDIDYPDGFIAHAMGNRTRPALDIIPAAYDFGPEVIGSPITKSVTLKSIGGMSVKIKGVYMDQAATDAGFRVEFPGPQPTVQTPVELQALETLIVNVVYDPARASPTDSIGMPQTESGQMVVSGDMFAGNQYMRVSGFAVEGACTKPIIEFLNDFNEPGDGCPVLSGYPAEDQNTRICRTDDGFEVPTGTLIRLSGEKSFSPFGQVTGWTWSAGQPDGSQAFFIPEENVVDPVFMAGAAGTYEFMLDVADGQSHTACTKASLTVTTRTQVKADILLSWKPVNPFTPTPPYMGQDVDLHFTHPNAGKDGTEPDGDNDGLPDWWFDVPWDCFWLYPSPAKDLWGDASPWMNDLVRLRHDSEDGSTPEVLSMGLDCPNGRAFKVGAYLFDDHGYGDVDATVQIFIEGVLAYSNTVRLTNLDMWYIGDLKCVTTGLDKGATFIPKSPVNIAADYVNTDFVGP